MLSRRVRPITTNVIPIVFEYPDHHESTISCGLSARTYDSQHITKIRPTLQQPQGSIYYLRYQTVASMRLDQFMNVFDQFWLFSATERLPKKLS
jgi:hypothetical protein